MTVTCGSTIQRECIVLFPWQQWLCKHCNVICTLLLLSFCISSCVLGNECYKATYSHTCSHTHTHTPLYCSCLFNCVCSLTGIIVHSLLYHFHLHSLCVCACVRARACVKQAVYCMGHFLASMKL